MFFVHLYFLQGQNKLLEVIVIKSFHKQSVQLMLKGCPDCQSSLAFWLTWINYNCSIENQKQKDSSMVAQNFYLTLNGNFKEFYALMCFISMFSFNISRELDRKPLQNMDNIISQEKLYLDITKNLFSVHLFNPNKYKLIK